jgi:hypothetical protein
MTCDELRTVAGEGAPLDEAARVHLAECAACGEEFAELRALASSRPVAPEGLRDRVLAAAFPVRRSSPWLKAAALFLIGLAGGFIGGYVAKAPAPGEIVYKEKPVPMETSPSDDYVANVAIAGERVYGKMVKVEFDQQVHVKNVVIDPFVKSCEKYCPVARQLGSLAAKRPDVVVYRKPEKKEY